MHYLGTVPMGPIGLSGELDLAPLMPLRTSLKEGALEGGIIARLRRVFMDSSLLTRRAEAEAARFLT